MKFTAMQLQNIEFLRQFRSEQVELPCEERQYRNAHFMHFSHSRKERRRIEKFLDDHTTQSALVGTLINAMNREDVVVHRRLDTLLGKLVKTFGAYGRKEPCATAHFSRLSGEITRFMELSADCREKMQRSFPDTINCSRDIRVLKCAVREYFDLVCFYHDVFSALLEEELGRSGATALLSPVEESLLQVTTLVKTQLFSLEATLNRLVEWRTRYRQLEVQGVYN